MTGQAKMFDLGVIITSCDSLGTPGTEETLVRFLVSFFSIVLRKPTGSLIFVCLEGQRG